jgi:hypothetical protein
MRPLFLALTLAACAPSAPDPDPSAPPSPVTSDGEDRTLQGTVVAFDLEPMSYDADGIVTVRTDDGEDVRVLLPARYGLCAATYDDWGELEVDDRVSVRGTVTEEGAVRPCTSADHYFRLG